MAVALMLLARRGRHPLWHLPLAATRPSAARLRQNPSTAVSVVTATDDDEPCAATSCRRWTVVHRLVLPTWGVFSEQSSQELPSSGYHRLLTPRRTRRQCSAPLRAQRTQAAAPAAAETRAPLRTDSPLSARNVSGEPLAVVLQSAALPPPPGPPSAPISAGPTDHECVTVPAAQGYSHLPFPQLCLAREGFESSRPCRPRSLVAMAAVTPAASMVQGPTGNG